MTTDASGSRIELDQDIQRLFPGERHFLEIASLEPSFAGFFMEGDVLVAHVSDPSRHSEVRAALTSRLGEIRRGRAAPDRVETRDVDFSFLQLARWRNLAHHHVFDIEDVVSLDMDERANRVTIGLETGSGEAEAERLLSSLNVPLDAVRFVLDEPATPGARLIEHQTPLPGGYRIRTENDSGNLHACSHGFNARTWPNGISVFVTASHCTRYVLKPDPSDTRAFNIDRADTTHYLGNEYLDPQGCLGSRCRATDAALLTVPHDSIEFGYIARTETRGTGLVEGSITIDSSNPRFEIVGTAGSYPAAGDTIQKMGASAGWTYGTVNETCKERFFEWDPDVNYTITCAFEADFRLNAGDSGGPVFTWLGGDDVILEGIGIGHDDRYGNGGEGIFSPYLAIEEDLSDDFLQAWNEPLSAFIPGPWDAPPNEPCTWYSNVWGGRAPYSYQWSGALTGTNSTVTGIISESSYLSLTVTDADSNQDVDSRLIEVGEVEECVY